MRSDDTASPQRALNRQQRRALATEQRRVLRLPETERLTGVCSMTLWRWECAGKFPKRFKLNPDISARGAIGHDYGEVMVWLDARMASREQQAAA